MLNNKLLKFMSVLIAILLWFIVASDKILLVDSQVPIQFAGLSDGYAAVADVTNVDVKLKTYVEDKSSNNEPSVYLRINISKFPVGKTAYKLDESSFIIPDDYEIKEIKPKEIVITVEQVIAKQINITPKLSNTIAKGYKVSNIVLDPQTVVIEGLSSIIDTLDSVNTKPINIASITSTTNFDVGFEHIEGVKVVNPSSTSVRIIVEQDIIQKTFENVYVSCVDLNEAYTMKTIPSIDNITVRGRADVVDDFAEQIAIYVDCSKVVTAGNYIRNVNYRLKSDHIDVLDISPKQIQVEIDNK